ncbi:ribonuclease III domain-containing protein [Russula compacta]|nr:ribonuclease III domain-containing protein [Russula compacta]
MSPPERIPRHSSLASPREVPDGRLPSLPEIQSEQILNCIFTNNSRAVDFQVPESDATPNIEELWPLGAQVVGLVLTDLIQRVHPHLQVGPASKMRDYARRKSVLAELCVLYGLHNRLNLAAAHQDARFSRNVQVQAQVFQAYVGGVYREQGIEVVSEWLTLLFSSHVEHLLPLTDAALLSSTMDALLTPTLESPQARKIDWGAIIGPMHCIDSPVTTHGCESPGVVPTESLRSGQVSEAGPVRQRRRRW